MSDLAEVLRLVREQGDAWNAFKSENELRLTELEKRLGRQALFGEPAGSTLSADDREALNRAAISLLAGDVPKAYQLFRQVKGMTVGSDPDGGYVVLPHYSDQMTRVMAEISPMARLARTVNLERGDAFEEIVDADEAAASWVSESQSRSDTAHPELDKLRIELHEIYAQPKASQKLLDTASRDIMGWLIEKVGEAFGTTESAAFHTGNGVGKPRGFLDYPTAATADASRAWGTVEHIASGANGDFAASGPADKLIDMVTALKPQYRAGAIWLMNRQTAAKIQKFKDADGIYIWQRALTLGQPDGLLGFPVEISEDMPAIAANSLSVALGNFKKGYTITRRLGVRFLVDPYTDKPNVKLYSYARVGGGLANSEAIKLLKFTA